MVHRDPDTGIVSVPDWQLGLIVTVMLLATGGLGTWAGTTIAEHSSTLATHSEAITTLKETVREQKEISKLIYEELRRR